MTIVNEMMATAYLNGFMLQLLLPVIPSQPTSYQPHYTQ